MKDFEVIGQCSMSWNILTSGRLYRENDAKIYRSQTMQMKEEVSKR